LTNEGVQAKALKAMLDRAVESKNDSYYDYEAGNINEYGWAQNLVEDSWIVTANFGDYIGRFWSAGMYFIIWSVEWLVEIIQ
jgi:hypothetical protein